MGLGLLGRGVGDAEFLARHGAEVLVTDLKTEAELAESVARLASFSNVTFHLGGHREEDFKNRDFILKAAGVPLDSPYIAEARKNGISIKMSASWFAELAGIPVVGVTGTRGKTTTTMLLYEILKGAGKHVLLGGNVRGVSTLALLDNVIPESVALFELDSWQLQGWGEAEMSPTVSVFTTFLPDHLNYYPDMASYLKDKAQIFLHQKTGDTFILGAQAKDAVLGAYTLPVSAQVVDASLVEGWDMKLLGTHNRDNVACAVAAARALGVDDATARKVVSEFRGVPGRLEQVREVDGVAFYNDTTATSPDAVVAALRALDHDSQKNVVLIAGGMDKGSGIEEMVEAIRAHTKAVVFLKGNGTDRLVSFFPEAPVYDVLHKAFTHARALAQRGDVVVLSPGFSSKNMFLNEYDRGDQFNALVSTVPDLSLLKPKVRKLIGELVEECKKERFQIVVSRGFRTFEEQDALYAKGRSEAGNIVTNAKGGRSYHNFGVAFDVRPVAEKEEDREALYKKAGAVGKRLGLEWGGDWKEFVDLPHFQLPCGYSLDDFNNGTVDETKFE